MILLDTNVLIYAYQPKSTFHTWATNLIADAVMGGGAVVNAISLAEYCVLEASPETVPYRLEHWGVKTVDVPASAAEICAEAYRLYSKRRREALPENPAPKTPLPDFFIGAHASVMGWDIATADEGRFRTYFPEVTLHTPADAPE